MAIVWLGRRAAPDPRRGSTRAAQDPAELDEAQRCARRRSACSPTTSSKRQEAEREAEAIVARAKKDAERLADDAKAKADEFVARRTRAAEQKIAQAEVQAIAEVRAAAADAAVEAAERIFRDRPRATSGESLFDKGLPRSARS